MKMLFKNKEEYELYQQNMKDVFGKNIKFVTKCDLLTKEYSYEWILNIGGKGLAGEAVFENNDCKSDSEPDTFIEKRVNNLKKEAQILDKKIANENTRENFGTYKNLIQAYTEILRLIERYDWQLKYSEYIVGCDSDNGKSFNEKQVAVWEQNSDGNIRNHKIWNIKDDFKEDVYIDTYMTNNGTYNFAAYHNNEVYYINSSKYSYREVVDQLINILKLEDKNIFIDIHGIGLGIADELEVRNIKYNKLNVHKL